MSKQALVLDEKSGKMITPAQAKVLAVLDITGLDYAVTGLNTSDAEWYGKWVASGRSIKGVTRPRVHHKAAASLCDAGLVQIFHDYMDEHEIQVRRIENARPLPVYTEV